MSQSGRDRLRSTAPYLVATAWMALGWAFLRRGVEHPGVAYRPWAFRTHAYSDLLAMTGGSRYLHGGRPLPYVEDRIEYPVLLGAALCGPVLPAGGTDRALHGERGGTLALPARGRRPPAAPPRREPWWLAGTPAIAYFGALNWDLVPIALLLAAVLAAERERPVAAGVLSALGVSAKLWPVALLPAAMGSLPGAGGSRTWRAPGGRSWP